MHVKVSKEFNIDKLIETAIQEIKVELAILIMYGFAFVRGYQKDL